MRRSGSSLLALLACASVAGADPLVRLEGALHAAERPSGALGDEVGGFLLEAAGESDLRIAPAALSLATASGSLAGVALSNARVRHVDVSSGRPLDSDADGSCTTGFEEACLAIASNFSIGPEDPNAEDPLRNSGAYPAYPPLGDAARTFDPADLASDFGVYSILCSATLGANPNDRRTCNLTYWMSRAPMIALGQEVDASPEERKSGASSVTLASFLANTLSGNGQARQIVRAQFTHNVPVPYVTLPVDPCDEFLSNGDGTCSTTPGRGPVAAFSAGANLSLNEVLTDEQEALLGCGPFYGTDCESDGVDFLNAEASVLLQAFPGYEGDYGEFIRSAGFDAYSIGGADDLEVPFPVPGTTSFDGALPGARGTDSDVAVLPGARGPSDPTYDGDADGSTTGLVVPVVNGTAQPHDFGPAAGLAFRSEMAALSWNLMMSLVAFSRVPSGVTPAADEFDHAAPMRTGPGLCSFRQPHQCKAARNLAARLLADDPRGVPRARWDWEASLGFEITAAAGDLAEFAGGTAYVVGPEAYGSIDGEMAVTILLEPPAGVTPTPSDLVGAFGAGPDEIEDTEDDAGRRHGWAYGIVSTPEATSGAAAAIALVTLQSLARRRFSRRA